MSNPVILRVMRNLNKNKEQEMKNLNWYNIFDKNEPNKKSAFMTLCATSKNHAIEKITEVCGKGNWRAELYPSSLIVEESK